MNRQALLAHLSIETRTLEIWLQQEWLVPPQRRDGDADAEPRFSDAGWRASPPPCGEGPGVGVVTSFAFADTHGTTPPLTPPRKGEGRPTPGGVNDPAR